jgi:GntR family transcriptional regulator, rspAB operon transcriptional repressor
MPPHLTKKAEAPPGSAAANRRSGRPRAATAASKIYSDLRSQLVSLQRRPGEVVSEAEIALSYGVSRTPVREAILKLSDEGLLEIFPQSGIFVSRIPIAALPEAIIIRKALEETTARLAAERATSSQILTLHAILERRYRRLTLPQQGRIARTIAEHEAILAAIEAHDPAGAKIAMEVHLERLLSDISATQNINPEFFDEPS